MISRSCSLAATISDSAGQIAAGEDVFLHELVGGARPADPPHGVDQRHAVRLEKLADLAEKVR